MKKSSVLFTALALGGALLGSTELSAKPGKPVKRQLTALAVTACDDETSTHVSLIGDCTSENANVEYNITVSLSYFVPDDPNTLEVNEESTVAASGEAELEVTIPLTQVLGDNPATTDLVETDFCLGTAGSTSFSDADVQSAIDALVAALSGGYELVGEPVVSVSVSAKAWTTSNAFLDSKPTAVAIVPCASEN